MKKTIISIKLVAIVSVFAVISVVQGQKQLLNGVIVERASVVAPGNGLTVPPGASLAPPVMSPGVKWTDEQYREWEQSVVSSNKSTGYMPQKPEIITPDFSVMTDEEINMWEDSIVNLLYPPVEIGRRDSIPKNIYPPAVMSSSPSLRSSYTNTYVPQSYNIDRSRPSSSIPLKTELLPSGAMSYNIPIEIYPGVGGHQPQISISYNSLGSDGVLGKGWNIGGLSSISRGNKSVYYDGKSEGTLMDKSDPFFLDGMRLLKIGESSTQITYESERGYIKATAYLSGNAVRYFEVRYPNGSIGVYGNTSNYGTSYISYPLTSMTDRFGNIITYTNEYVNNHYVISGVYYGNASVIFHYQTYRANSVVQYTGGTKVTENYLLSEVICKHGSSELRRYTFSYKTQRGYSVLERIDLTASGLSLNPLRFYYGENNTAYSYSTSQTQLMEWYNFSSPGQLRVVRGKFDYYSDDDGVIVTPEKNPYYNHTRTSNAIRHSQNRYDNYYDGEEKIFLYTGLNDASGWANYLPNLKTEAGFIDIFCANIDGRYEDEVIKVNNIRVDNTYDERLTFKVYAGNLYNGIALYRTHTFTLSTAVKDADGGYSVHPKFYYTGDFNGDGKMEVLAVSCHNPIGLSDRTSKCYLFDLEAGSKLYENYVFPYKVEFVGKDQPNEETANENTDRIIIIDYDGDGKSDICHINDQGTHIYTFDVSGTSYNMRKVASYTGITKGSLKSRRLLIGEFDGDGKPDLVVSPLRNGMDYLWSIYSSMGNGQFDKRTFSGTMCQQNDAFYLHDVNGDGLTDLIKCYSNLYFTYLTDANGAFSYYESSTGYDANSMFVPTDINSSNYFGRIVCLKNSGGIANKFAYPRNDAREKLLTGAVNSLGVIDKNHYRQLNNPGNFYARGYGAIYPYTNFHGPLHVTVGREQYYNGQLYSDADVSYENAVLHGQGLGFCGFSKIRTYDRIRQRESVRTFDPYRFGILTEEESLFSKTTNTYTVNVQSNKTVKSLLTGKTVQDKVKGVTQTVSYTYDAYGNPTQETVNMGDGIMRTTVSGYENNTGTPYILGFCRDRTVTITRNGQSNSSREYVHEYNSLLMPTLKYTYSNGNQTSSTAYAYNSLGNVTQESVKTYTSSTALATSYQYDSYGRLTRKTDPLGLYTTYEYNSATGYLSAERNHKSQATTYGYDGLGRTTSVSYPDGVTETTAYAWSSGAGLYTVSSSATGTPQTTVYYDAFGREVRRGVQRYNGATLYTDKAYDSYSRLQKESLPFGSSSSASLWDTYSYDGYDRPTSVTKASGKRTSYSYSGKNVTITKEGISSTQVYDAQGNLISITDPAGTITYNLRADGQPSSIVAPGNVTTSFGYDIYGRQTSINDPSAGNRSFGYDAAGNMNRETDANNRVKSMVYDAYNRLSSKTLPEFSTSYRYNGDGLLEAETSTGGTSRSYQYDAFGRLSKDRDSGPDGKWLEKTYQYSDGNVYSIQYASQSENIGAEYHVYTYGHLSEVKFGSVSVWKLNGENAFGQPISVATGTVSRTYTYNGYGIPSGRSASSSAAGTFQNHTYSFDAATGNLSFRKDNTRNLQEGFTYDALNRLKMYAGRNMEYDAKGNITQKNDVATNFVYNTPGKPYAISGANIGTNIGIPLRSQSVNYTSFERPSNISENGYTATFTYDASGERKKMQLTGNNYTLTRYYLGGAYEIDGGTAGPKERLYIGGDAYSAPVVYVKQNGGWALHYILRDYLGSITHVTNASGGIVQELSYDAWGRLRDPVNQSVFAPDNEPEPFLGRGYTGHEHLPKFGLINMNARLYDPAVGRFLSPDPYVQSPDFSQNFNRYSYALNNPLRYVDEDGEWVHIVIGAVIGGVVNLAANWKKVDNFWQGLGYFGVGAAAGAAGGYVGGMAAGVVSIGGAVGGAISGAAGGATSGFIGGAGNAWMNGANFGQGIQSGLIGGGIGALSGAVIGGTIGAIQHQKQMLSFRRGCNRLGVNGGDPVPATDQFLSDAQKAWYPDAPMDRVKVFTTEHVPEAVQTSLDNAGAGAGTRYLSMGGKLTGYSNVYFNKNLAFSSAKDLFYTMGHEFVHVSQYAALAGVSTNVIKQTFNYNGSMVSFQHDLMEFHAYGYQNSLGGTSLNSFSPNLVRAMATQWSNYFSKLSYTNFSWTNNVIMPF